MLRVEREGLDAMRRPARRRRAPVAALALAVALARLRARAGDRAGLGAATALFADATFLPPVGRGRGAARRRASSRPARSARSPGCPTARAGTATSSWRCSIGRGAAARSSRPRRPARTPTFPRRGAPTRRLPVRGFMPWTGRGHGHRGWTRLEIRALGPATVELAAPLGRRDRASAPSVRADRRALRLRGEARAEARLLRDGRTIALVAPPPARARHATVVASRPRRLDPGAPASPARRGSRRARPARPSTCGSRPVGGAAADAAPPDRDAHVRRLARAHRPRRGRAELARGATIEHPDPRVQGALVSARRLLVGDRERRDGATHFLGSPFQYRDLYLRDGARVVHALALLGRPTWRGRRWRSLYEFQWPGGAFLSQRGQLDGTGQALWALGLVRGARRRSGAGRSPARCRRCAARAGSRCSAAARRCAAARRRASCPTAIRATTSWCAATCPATTRGRWAGSRRWRRCCARAAAPPPPTRSTPRPARTARAGRGVGPRGTAPGTAAARRRSRAGDATGATSRRPIPAACSRADDPRVVALDALLRAPALERGAPHLRRARLAAPLPGLRPHAGCAAPRRPRGSSSPTSRRSSSTRSPTAAATRSWPATAASARTCRRTARSPRCSSTWCAPPSPTSAATRSCCWPAPRRTSRADATTALVVRGAPTRFGALDLAARIAPDGRAARRSRRRCPRRRSSTGRRRRACARSSAPMARRARSPADASRCRRARARGGSRSSPPRARRRAMSGGKRTRRSSTGRPMVSRGGGGAAAPAPRHGSARGVILALVVVAIAWFVARTMEQAGKGGPTANAPGGRADAGDAAGYARDGRAAEARQDYDAALATLPRGAPALPGGRGAAGLVRDRDQEPLVRGAREPRPASCRSPRRATTACAPRTRRSRCSMRRNARVRRRARRRCRRDSSTRRGACPRTRSSSCTRR